MIHVYRFGTQEVDTLTLAQAAAELPGVFAENVRKLLLGMCISTIEAAYTSAA